MEVSLGFSPRGNQGRRRKGGASEGSQRRSVAREERKGMTSMNHWISFYRYIFPFLFFSIVFVDCLIICSVLWILFGLWIYCGYLVYFPWGDLRATWLCFCCTIHHMRVLFLSSFPWNAFWSTHLQLSPWIQTRNMGLVALFVWLVLEIKPTSHSCLCMFLPIFSILCLLP